MKVRIKECDVFLNGNKVDFSKSDFISIDIFPNESEEDEILKLKVIHKKSGVVVLERSYSNKFQKVITPDRGKVMTVSDLVIAP